MIVNNSILDEYKDTKEIHEKFSSKVEGLLEDILKQNGINYHSIDSRVKEENSLATKVENADGKYRNLEDITDISGIRIITYFSDDVDKIAKIIQKEFEIDDDNSVDKRAKLDPDRFGYLSLHYVVKLNEKRTVLSEYQRFKDLKIEIQIRSILQHAWAEIEHDLGYKSKDSVPRKIKRDFSRLAGLLELADEEFVKIRSVLDNYKEKIKEEINSEPAKLLIDAETLKQLVSEKNNLVAAIDGEICEELNAELIEVNQSSLEQYLTRFNYLNFKTIDEILSSLQTNKNVIVQFSKAWTQSTDSKGKIIFNRGISLFYLAFVVIAQQGSIDEVNRFLSTITGNKFETQGLANRVLSTYNEINNASI